MHNQATKCGLILDAPPHYNAEENEEEARIGEGGRVEWVRVEWGERKNVDCLPDWPIGFQYFTIKANQT